MLCLVPMGGVAQSLPGYAGSVACTTCHPSVYTRWSKTAMANVVRDPKTNA